MKKNLLILVALLTSATISAQNGGTIMAIFEKTIRNKNLDKLLRKLEQEIPDSSWSADLEAGSDFKEAMPGAVSVCLNGTA